MAPLDGSGQELFLANLEDMASRKEPAAAATLAAAAASRAVAPQRRAVSWADALDAIAKEIEQRQGRRRAEVLLRAVGARMSRDMLKTLPGASNELEPSINRALSTLDWGWVAIPEGRDTIVFEHRVPWPFEKRFAQLCYVLEGFYTDILNRASGDPAMQMRLAGRRAGALVFQWIAPDLSVGLAHGRDTTIVVGGRPAAIVATPQPKHSPAEMFAALDDLKQGKPAEPASSRQMQAAAQPARDIAVEPRPAAPQPNSFFAEPGVEAPRPDWLLMTLVGVSVFVMLFALGLLTSGGDLAGRLLQSLSGVVDSGDRGPEPALQKRARNGDAAAQVQIAMRLVSGQDGEPNYAEAARWLKLAAVNGSVEAQYDLGVLAERGLGVKQDRVEAAILYAKAAGAGFQQAQTSLGRLYASGLGVPNDPVSAYAWFRVAERLGDRDAASQRAQLVTGLAPGQLQAGQILADSLYEQIGSISPPPARSALDRVIASAR